MNAWSATATMRYVAHARRDNHYEWDVVFTAPVATVRITDIEDIGYLRAVTEARKKLPHEHPAALT